VDFSIGRYLEQGFAAPLVQKRQWHLSQKIKQLQNGGLELSLTLGSLEDIERWILSWGQSRAGAVATRAKRIDCKNSLRVS
jgi:hypothetical protein